MRDLHNFTLDNCFVNGIYFEKVIFWETGNFLDIANYGDNLPKILIEDLCSIVICVGA